MKTDWQRADPLEREPPSEAAPRGSSGKIVWIASYPKSGNTWMRVFIENLVSGSPGLDLNHFSYAGFMASSRSLFDRISGIRAADLLAGEIEDLRPEVYRTLSRRSTGPLFLKIHDAYEAKLFPADATMAAIHLVRNPLDIAVSYAFHVSSPPDFDAAIKRICSPRNALTTKADRLGRQLTVRLGDWSSHSASWIRGLPFRVLTLRYEDLLEDPLHHFARAAEVVAPRASRDRIREAVERSRFDQLRNFEQRRGFAERGSESRAFFRAGRAGTWQGELSDRQVEQIVDAHHDMMLRFGYLNGSPSGQPTNQADGSSRKWP